MNGILKRVVILVTVLALVVIPCTSALAVQLDEDKQVTAGRMASEIILRPLGLVGTVMGLGIFVVTLPFSAIGGNTKPAYDRLLADPFVWTFARPLGEF